MANKDRYLYIRRSRIPGAGRTLHQSRYRKGERVTEYKGKLQRWSEVKDEDGYNAYIFKINSRWAVNALPAVKTSGRYANDARGLNRVEGLRNNSEYDTEGKKSTSSPPQDPKGRGGAGGLWSGVLRFILEDPRELMVSGSGFEFPVGYWL